MSDETVEQVAAIELNCKVCTKQWVVKIAMPMGLASWAASLSKSRCEHCGAGARHITLGRARVTTKPADEAGRGIYCERCDDYTPHRHLHDTAHGIAGTHMAGSERYQCTKCGDAIHPQEGKLKGLTFLYD